MSAEVLKRLTPSAIDIGHVGGGHASLTFEEVAGSLAGLSEGPELLIRAAVMGEPVLQRLYTLGKQSVTSLAVSEGWRASNNRPILLGMTVMAIDEIVSPKDVMCKTCGGTGAINDASGNPTLTCENCGGNGNKPYSNAYMAKMCGMDESSWRQTWRPRYPKVKAIFDSWKDAAESHVMRQLFEES